MAQEFVYQIYGEFDNNLPYFKSVGFIDAGVAGHGLDHVNPQFVAACQAVGMSPIYNGGNDTSSTCGGQDIASCYANLRNSGYMAAGGEATPASEQCIAVDNIIYINMGGAGINPNQDSFKALGFCGKGKYGCISYIESYEDSTWTIQDTINAMISSAQAGCLETGVMIGAWMPQIATNYAQCAEALENAGYKFSGFALWGGVGWSMTNNYQKQADCIATLQENYPPTMVNLNDRVKGVQPTPTPTPKPTPPPYDWSGVYELFSD